MVVANGGQDQNVARLQTSGGNGMGLFITKDGSARITGGDTSGVQMVDDDFYIQQWKIEGPWGSGTVASFTHILTDWEFTQGVYGSQDPIINYRPDTPYIANWRRTTDINGDLSQTNFASGYFPSATGSEEQYSMRAKNYDRFVQVYHDTGGTDAMYRMFLFVEKKKDSYDFQCTAKHDINAIQNTTSTMCTFIPAGCRWSFAVTCKKGEFEDVAGNLIIFKMGADRYTDVVSI